MPDGLNPSDQLFPRLAAVQLPYLEGAWRFKRLDHLESHYRCTQYEGRRYDWDGCMRGYGGMNAVEAAWYVPIGQRKPSTTYNLARLITRRFTSMVFGSDRFPQLVVDGDEDAQDYVRELARVARLNLRMQELRNKGGAQGSACASFAFVEGKPRITVHNAKHITILGWADRYLCRPESVLEAYSYNRTVWDVASGRPKEARFYFARYWDANQEIVWDPIPEQVAKQRNWSTAVPSKTVNHGFGFCPVYWAQNLPDSDSVDGDCDFEGTTETLDQINVLLSATSRGTVSNVDPTLVIKDDPGANQGVVRKGTGHAIFSKLGAEYLELRGDSLKAALALIAELKQQTLDTVGVVLGDLETMAAKAQSAAALRILYMPMITQADVFREQYGGLLVQLMTDMLRAARMIAGRAPGPVEVTRDGHKVQNQATVTLEPKVSTGEDGKVTTTARKPGTSENLTLNWPPYFPNTWTDVLSAVQAVQAARGEHPSPVISRRTAVENVAPLLGIADVDQELEDIENDRVEDAALMAQAMADAEPGGGDEGPGEGKGGDGGEDD